MPLIYTSRSRVETFQECSRRGYINFLWGGRGIVKRGVSVYLSTGSYTHMGLEHIFRCVQRKDVIDEYEIDQAVTVAVEAYRDEIKERGFDLEDGEDRNNESYIVNEQCALVEAFIRAFSIRVLPDLLARFRIMDIEREEFYVTNDNIVVQGKLDVTFEEIVNGDYHIVSFKTAGNWDRRQEKANEHDNQGLSETFLLEHRLHEENEFIDNMIMALGFEGLPDHIEKGLHNKIKVATQKYLSYIDKFRKNEKVMGVIMIYMMKGKRYESATKGLWHQHCPLIRAYRKLVGTQYEYASSIWYDKPENKSGKGRLGKGWEPFTVWDCEEVGGVKGWINMLVSNNLGTDVIGESFKIPAPYFRNKDHIDSWMRQTTAIENDIQQKMIKLYTMSSGEGDLAVELDSLFPQSRKHCHYPTDCQYLKVCYNRAIFDDPIGSGEFLWRVPHHKAEAEEHKRLFQINNVIQTDVVSNIEQVNAALDDEVIIDA